MKNMNNHGIKLKFPDGQEKEFPSGVTGLDILKTLPQRLQKEALGIKVNDQVKSLPEPIEQDAEIGQNRMFVFDLHRPRFGGTVSFLPPSTLYMHLD